MKLNTKYEFDSKKLPRVQGSNKEYRSSCPLGSLNTRHFCTRYCDKKILR